MRPWSAAIVALFVLLSGCAGSDGAGDLPAGVEGEGPRGKDPTAALELAPLVFESDEPLNGTIAIDDSFPLSDTCNADPNPGCTERLHDLTAQLPAGVPMEVTVEVSWPAGDGIFHMETWLEGDGMIFLRVDNTTFENSRWRWSALLVTGSTTQAVVISGGPQTAAQPNDNPYHLDVTFTANNQTVPELIPIAVAMGPDSTLRAESFDGEPVPFLLYGPDDQLVAKVEGNVTLPADAVPGDYVAMPLDRATFLVPGGGEMRFVGVLFTYSEEVAIPPGSAATVSVSSPSAPFLAGAYYISQQQTPLMFGATYGLTLTDPDGVEVVVGSACNPFCLGGFSTSWSTGFGKPLKAGSYTLTAESQVAHDSYAGAFLVSFDRSAT